MQISVVIPNYNGKENLKNNLPRVLVALEKSNLETELIIIDDASTDGSIDLLRRGFTNIKTIENITNLGFAESCNIGVKAAKSKIVVLLNTDVYPDENFLKFLTRHFDTKQVFAVGCLEKTIDKNGNVIGVRGVGKLFFKNGIFQHSPGDLNSDETDWVCGGSGAFRRSMFLELNGFDKRFAPFYWEDIDLSYRAKLKGYQLIFEKKSVVYHQHIEGSIAKKYSKEEISEISFRNQIKFTKKHIKSLGQKLKFLLFCLKHCLIKTHWNINPDAPEF